jgi:hypothetical protein
MANELEDDLGLSGIHSVDKNAPLYLSGLSRVLARRLANVKREQIMFPLEPARSTRIDARILAEKAIGSVVDWWPLSAPWRELRRITWSCVSIVFELLIESDQ